jgi:hypothetical protein
MRQTARLILQKKDYIADENGGDFRINERIVQEIITTYSPRVLKKYSNRLFTSSHIYSARKLFEVKGKVVLVLNELSTTP